MNDSEYAMSSQLLFLRAGFIIVFFLFLLFSLLFLVFFNEYAMSSQPLCLPARFIVVKQPARKSWLLCSKEWAEIFVFLGEIWTKCKNLDYILEYLYGWKHNVIFSVQALLP